MAMVTAMRAGKVVRVSRAAYEANYKNKGYRLMAGQVTKKQEAYEPEQGSRKQENIPISEMNKKQLVEFAREHEIDTSAAQTVNEAREIIREELKRRKM